MRDEHSCRTSTPSLLKAKGEDFDFESGSALLPPHLPTSLDNPNPRPSGQERPWVLALAPDGRGAQRSCCGCLFPTQRKPGASARPPSLQSHVQGHGLSEHGARPRQPPGSRAGVEDEVSLCAHPVQLPPVTDEERWLKVTQGRARMGIPRSLLAGPTCRA